MSASIEGIIVGSHIQFTLYYLLLEGILLYLWSRGWRKTENKIQAKSFFISYLIGASLILISIFAQDNIKLVLWILGVLSESVGPIIAWSKLSSKIPVHTSHIIERHGLFTIILLGEGVVAISNNMHFPTSFHPLDPLLTSYGIIISLWWIYFDCSFGFSTNLSKNMLKTFI